MAQTTLRCKKRKTFSEWINEEGVAGIVCTMPFIIGFFLFLVVPMLISGYYSFCDFDILSDPVFAGMKNFRTMLTDAKFWTALQVTFYYAFISVPLRLLFHGGTDPVQKYEADSVLSRGVLSAVDYRRLCRGFDSVEAHVCNQWYGEHAASKHRD